MDGQVGLVGFCFGGGLAFNIAAKEPVAALVSYYGSALPMLLDLAPRVTVPSLHHFGTADSFIDRESVARVRAAVTASPATAFHEYDGADHAFDNPDLPWHHPEASVRAWARTVEFLGEQLPVGATTEGRARSTDKQCPPDRASQGRGRVGPGSSPM